MNPEKPPSLQHDMYDWQCPNNHCMGLMASMFQLNFAHLQISKNPTILSGGRVYPSKQHLICYVEKRRRRKQQQQKRCPF